MADKRINSGTFCAKNDLNMGVFASGNSNRGYAKISLTACMIWVFQEFLLIKPDTSEKIMQHLQCLL